MSLGRLALLTAAATLKRGVAALPSGETVAIRELTVRERDEFGERVRSGAKALGPWVVSVGAIDDDGKRLLSDADVKVLEAGAPEVVEEVARAILVLSGLAKPKPDPAAAPAAEGDSPEDSSGEA